MGDYAVILAVGNSSFISRFYRGTRVSAAIGARGNEGIPKDTYGNKYPRSISSPLPHATSAAGGSVRGGPEK